MVSNILGIIEQSNNCERLMRAGSVPALLHIVKTEEKASSARYLACKGLAGIAAISNKFYNKGDP